MLTRSDPTEAVGRLDQLMDVARLERRMTGIGHDAQVCFREVTMKGPCACHGAHDIVTPLDDHGADMPDAPDVRDEFLVTLEKARLTK